MRLFAKKEKIILTSEEQKEEYIEKLEKAHVAYDIRRDKDTVFDNNRPVYIFRVYTDDLKKVV